MLDKLGKAFARTQKDVSDLRAEVERVSKIRAIVKNGKDGAPGADGQDGDNGSQGDEGPRGQVGERGRDGRDGAQGTPGGIGVRGQVGEIGQTGPRGVTGPVGAKGPKGDRGDRGVPGAKGDPGKDGASITQVSLEKGTLSVWIDGVKNIVGKISPSKTPGAFTPAVGGGGGSRAFANPLIDVRSLTDLPKPRLKDGVLTIVLEDEQYRLIDNLDSAFPLAFPGAGKRATWTTVNGAIYNYTGTDACWRDKDAEGNVEVHGQAEFQAPNGNMFDILAVTGAWSFQAVSVPRFRNCISLGIVSGGAGGNGSLNSFFGSITGFFDGLILDNLFFNEESTMFVDGNNAAKLDYDGQTVNFTVGETVTGGTSGATGIVRIDTDAGAAGTLVLSDIVGIFQNDETLTGSVTGVAVADGVLRNTVMFTIQGAATSGSINLVNLTFFASENETLFDLKPEIQAGVASINLRGNQIEGFQTATAFAPGSLTQKDLKVFSTGNSFIPNSKTIGSAFVKGNSTATSIPVSGTFNDIDFGTLSAASNIERFTLTDTGNGEMRYDGLVDLQGEIAVSLSAFSTGGNRVFSFRFVKDSGSGFVVLPDDIIAELDIGSNLAGLTLLVPISLKTGDLIKPQVTRDAGTSTVTVKHYSVAAVAP